MGADPTIKNKLGERPLSIAFKNGDVDCINALMKLSKRDENPLNGEYQLLPSPSTSLSTPTATVTAYQLWKPLPVPCKVMLGIGGVGATGLLLRRVLRTFRR